MTSDGPDACPELRLARHGGGDHEGLGVVDAAEEDGHAREGFVGDGRGRFERRRTLVGD